ncbi:MAG: four helix bundle protein [Ignavibacteriales bacterium]|nr:four helix bundle protein [Ignavibacteriales bacterium]
MKTYKELIVWQKAINLVSIIYNNTKNFPKEEIYGLTNQIRRAAVSIPSNIAEGFGRNSKNDFKRFLRISIGSLFEVQTQLEISKNLQFLSELNYQIIFDATREIEAMLASLIRKLK